MAVTWLWKSEKGFIVWERKLEGSNKKYSIKVGIYGGNCLGAHILRYREKNEQTGEIEKMYNFWGFWDDIDHLKRLLNDKVYPLRWEGNASYQERVKVIRVNTFYPEMVKVGILFAKYGFKVEMYYKEVK